MSTREWYVGRRPHDAPPSGQNARHRVASHRTAMELVLRRESFVPEIGVHRRLPAGVYRLQTYNGVQWSVNNTAHYWMVQASWMRSETAALEYDAFASSTSVSLHELVDNDAFLVFRRNWEGEIEYEGYVVGG